MLCFSRHLFEERLLLMSTSHVTPVGPSAVSAKVAVTMITETIATST